VDGERAFVTSMRFCAERLGFDWTSKRQKNSVAPDTKSKGNGESQDTKVAKESKSAKA
jgi:hypothetical protein